MNSEIVEENDLVFLVLDDRRRWLVQVRHNQSFHSHRGIIEFDDIIGKEYGSVVFSKPLETQGYKFYVLKPLPSDYILHMTRKTQIIYPEDAGMILLYSGIGPGSVVIEAGSGSGALTCILANYVRPNGHIYSYDIREKSLKRAKANVLKAKLDDIVSINYGDLIKEDFTHENVDAIILDLATPWDAIERIKKNLKLGGTLVSFSPTIEQVKKTVLIMKKNDFIEINTYELLKRRIQVKENATRPEIRMIGHTGYITFGRRIKNIKNPYRGKKPKNIEFINLDGMPLRS
ncbi:MAG: tRNA (adenine-N1)-methyltransferase [Promethearchaeota archaeon]